MQRFALAFLVMAIAIALLAVVVRGASKLWSTADDAGPGSIRVEGGSMQKLAFFLLLALMIYVAASGTA